MCVLVLNKKHILFADGLLYESNTSYYRKLVSDNNLSYSDWSNKCNGEFVKHIYSLDLFQSQTSSAIVIILNLL